MTEFRCQLHTQSMLLPKWKERLKRYCWTIPIFPSACRSKHMNKAITVDPVAWRACVLSNHYTLLRRNNGKKRERNRTYQEQIRKMSQLNHIKIIIDKTVWCCDVRKTNTEHWTLIHWTLSNEHKPKMHTKTKQHPHSAPTHTHDGISSQHVCVHYNPTIKVDCVPHSIFPHNQFFIGCRVMRHYFLRVHHV